MGIVLRTIDTLNSNRLDSKRTIVCEKRDNKEELALTHEAYTGLRTRYFGREDEGPHIHCEPVEVTIKHAKETGHIYAEPTGTVEYLPDGLRGH